MPFTPQQLSDLEEIKQLKHRYFRCIDTAYEAELIKLFMPDVQLDPHSCGHICCEIKNLGGEAVRHARDIDHAISAYF